MKTSKFKQYIKEEIISILTEESADDIKDKTNAQKELNKELEKTKELTSESTTPSYTDEDLDNLLQIVLKYVEDPDDAEVEVENFSEGGINNFSEYLSSNLLRDKEFIEWCKRVYEHSK